MTKLFSMRTLRTTIVAAAMAVAPAASFASVFISVGFAPPALPVYVQPVCPGDGYLWNPGYWAYGPEGYYWVPGVWVQPPTIGLLWTPGYWGWGGSAFIFHEGYWGPHVGFYGGINYGFGYGGVGFFGGRWDGGHFAYNTAVVNVNTTVIHNTYVDRTNVNVNVGVHTSFNGGAGGIQARPSAQEAAYEHENHVPPTTQQQQHVQMAHSDKANFASANGGHPAHLTAVTVNNYRSTTINNVNNSHNNGNTNVNNSHNNGNTNTGNTNTRISNTSNTNNTKISQTTNQNGNHDTAGSKTMAHTQAASHPKPPPPPKNNEKEGGKEPRR